MSDFFFMGGYAFFVWSAYGMTLLVLLLVFFQPLVQRKRLLQQHKRHQARQQRLARRNT